MNNFAELSDGDNAKFLVRWRGMQAGPYLASVIETKLAANEIGLLHEIFYDGKWVTIRDYIAEREAILRAERQAREEQERRAREEVERQAKEREEKERRDRERVENRQPDFASHVENTKTQAPAQALARIHEMLLRGFFVMSLLAFFLTNISISLPIVGKIDVSMFDFLTSKSDKTSTSEEKPIKPNISDVSNFQIQKANLGAIICAMSGLGLLLHYLLTIVWGVLAFTVRKTSSTLNTVWLSLGLQFPILFSIGIQMSMSSLKGEAMRQAGSDESSGMGALFGAALVNQISVQPGMTMWILMTLALFGIGIQVLSRNLAFAAKGGSP
jgi:hypothetical protein